jgi:hypothetical protein
VIQKSEDAFYPSIQQHHPLTGRESNNLNTSDPSSMSSSASTPHSSSSTSGSPPCLPPVATSLPPPADGIAVPRRRVAPCTRMRWKWGGERIQREWCSDPSSPLFLASVPRVTVGILSMSPAAPQYHISSPNCGKTRIVHCSTSFLNRFPKFGPPPSAPKPVGALHFPHLICTNRRHVKKNSHKCMARGHPMVWGSNWPPTRVRGRQRGGCRVSTLQQSDMVGLVGGVPQQDGA